MHGIDAVGDGHGRDQRHDHQDRRVNIHQRADNNEQQVEGQQEYDRGINVRLYPFERVLWNLGQDQKACETQSHGQDDHEAAHQRGALHSDARQVFGDAQVPEYQALEDEGIEHGDGGGFHKRCQAA